MASDYGRNFGFRVSDETRRSSMGRVKTPVGSALLIGTAVEIDYATPGGFLKAATATSKPRTGSCGLLVQEESWNRSIYQSDYVDSFDLAVAKPNTLSVITNGAGTKVWMRNTPAQTRADGRSIPAVTMFNPATIVAGGALLWDGTQWAGAADPTVALSFGEVVYYDAARLYLEAILTH